MTARTSSTCLARIVLALGLALNACASEEPPSSSDVDDADVGEVSSALPLAAVSLSSGASFAGLGLGATASTVGMNSATGSIGASGQIGTTLGAGPLGFSSNFGTGPMGFSTGPMGFNSSFGTGPIGFSSGGTTTISSGTGTAPVISHTCVGLGCP